MEEIKKTLKKSSSKKKAKIFQSFFKTGAGEYAEGDIFLGVTVPQVRKLSRKFKDKAIKPVSKLLRSKIHEERLLALLIFVLKYEDGNVEEKREIYKLYLRNTKYINNWDLVDLTAYHIVGNFLMNISRNPLYILAKSKILWERRIAIVSTFHFIKNMQFEDTLRISEILLIDDHDLIHKAVGWMLREVGKRDMVAEEKFLKKHYKIMPRTMLRYAIEKFPEKRRKAYLKGRI